MTAITVTFGTHVAAAFLLFAAQCNAGATPQVCVREDAMKAEAGASTLRTWRSVYDSFRRYKQCDDGAISEGYSASVADLLAIHWADIGELVKLVSSHPDFQRFVLHHVDETMTSDQANKIKLNIGRDCPIAAVHVCDLIKARFAELETN